MQQPVTRVICSEYRALWSAPVQMERQRGKVFTENADAGQDRARSECG